MSTRGQPDRNKTSGVLHSGMTIDNVNVSFISPQGKKNKHGKSASTFFTQQHVPCFILYKPKALRQIFFIR